MTDCIDRDMLLKMISHKPSSPTTDREDRLIDGFISAVKNCPAADVRPVVRGKWIDMGDFISCSSCNATRLKEFESDYGKVMRLDARTNFCPNCGADMRNPAEEGE